jgi:hypothetical protein
MVGLQSVERLFEHLQGQGTIPSMRADFGHEKDLVPPAFQTLAHPVFALPAVVFPAVVEKCDSVVDRFVNYPDSGLLIFRIPKMVSAEPQRGDLHIVPTELP